MRPRVDEHFWASVPGKWIAWIVGVMVAGGIVAGTAQVLHVEAIPQPPVSTTSGSPVQSAKYGALNHVYVTLQIFHSAPAQAWITEHNYHFLRPVGVPIYDRPSWVRYGPTTTVHVPAHSLVTLTIQDYDGQTGLLNAFYSYVQGTINNQEIVNGHVVKKLPPLTVSHTFTIHSIPDQNHPWLWVNIPVFGNPGYVMHGNLDHGSVPVPQTTTASFLVTGPGDYVWQCEAPCGTYYDGFGGPMETYGFMSGSFIVEPATPSFNTTTASTAAQLAGA